MRHQSKLSLHLKVLLSVMAIMASVAGCEHSEKEKEPVASVHVTPASTSAIEQVVTAEGIVFPLQQAVITPKITSTIKKYLVQRGSKVHKGQLLAVLENADLSAAAAQSRGELDQAQANYATTTSANLPEQMQKAELDAASAKAGFDAQQRVYNSRKDLFQQGAIPRRDLDAAEVSLSQAKSQAEIAQRQLDDLKRIGQRETERAASGQLSAAKGKYLNAASQLGYSEIRSPMSGIVTDRPQYAGELATANQPLITVMDMSRLIVKAHVAQQDAAMLKVGDAASIQIGGVSEPIDARVSLVSPALDPGSTTVEVWVESKKPNSSLRPGTSVLISVTAKTVKDALVLPDSAVFKNNEGDYVMVAGKDNHAESRPVQVGIRNGHSVQIVDGLKAGEPVITDGAYALPDKAAIKIESEKERPAAAKDKDDKEKD